MTTDTNKRRIKLKKKIGAKSLHGTRKKTHIFFYYYYHGCPGQLARTSTNPTDP